MACNGWSNYETWNVALWLDNEPSTADELNRIANSSRRDYERAQELKDYVNEMMPWDTLGASMASDLLSAALSEVDWLEIIMAHQEEQANEA